MLVEIHTRTYKLIVNPSYSRCDISVYFARLINREANNSLLAVKLERLHCMWLHLVAKLTPILSKYGRFLPYELAIWHLYLNKLFN